MSEVTYHIWNTVIKGLDPYRGVVSALEEGNEFKIDIHKVNAVIYTDSRARIKYVICLNEAIFGVLAAGNVLYHGNHPEVTMCQDEQGFFQGSCFRPGQSWGGV